MEDQPGAEMPRYKCHKEVWALKIAGIAPQNADGVAMIQPADSGYAAFPVSQEYQQKHKPQVGGYYVVYDDGYKSYSPAAPFESGYSLAPADFKARVRAEKAELDERLNKLLAFTAGAVFGNIPSEEQARMRMQAECMQAYSNVLGERIGAFGG
jgi:hypothetical protein